MGNLSNIGRIFYGLAMAALGFLTIYYRDFPYFLIPPKHSWISDHVVLVYLFGALLLLAGCCIVLGKKLLPVSLLLGTGLLLIFCFYFIPYQLMALSEYRHFGDWENAAKELALASGAFVIAAAKSNPDQRSPIGKDLIPLGIILYAVTIISFSFDHFIYAHEAAGYVPAWIPNPVTWLYITGSALLAAGIAIILNIKRKLGAALLGAMILIWVIILHIPRILAAGMAGDGGEISSGFLALAYCGIAFVIAGTTRPTPAR
jgi:uncharacterized membrane protein YphA (DoxX/SURF4 family)